MKNVSVYDISGRLVAEIFAENQKTILNHFIFAEGIYIAKIKLSNDKIATQKLINKK